MPQGQSPLFDKQGELAHTCSPSAQKVEAGGWDVLGHLLQHIKLHIIDNLIISSLITPGPPGFTAVQLGQPQNVMLQTQTASEPKDVHIRHMDNVELAFNNREKDNHQAYSNGIFLSHLQCGASEPYIWTRHGCWTINSGKETLSQRSEEEIKVPEMQEPKRQQCSCSSEGQKSKVRHRHPWDHT